MRDSTGADVFGNVLIVDDTPASLELLSGVLTDAGFVVRAVTDGRTALEMAAAEHPDCILLDVSMPGMDGFEVCRALKASTALREIPVIFLTALAETMDKLQAFEAGGADYVTKPFQVEEVLARVNAHVGLRRARSALVQEKISETRAAEEAKFTRVFMSMPACLAISRVRDGMFINVNDEFCRVFGSERWDVIGKTSNELGMWHDPADRDAVIAAMRNGIIRDKEMRFRARDGKTLTMRSSWQRLEIGGEEMILSILVDVSEALALEQQLRQSQKMDAIGQLAGGIAHDFNNLLTVIIGVGQLLLMKKDREAVEKADLDQMVQAAERAAVMTRQLLAFSRRQVIEPKDVNLNDVLRNIEKMLARMIREDIRLKTEVGRDLGLTRVDPGQIEQVIMNLVVNARDAMPDGGTVTMSTANATIDSAFAARHPGAIPGPYVRLSVTDTGTGMTPEVKAKIFEPFFTTKEVGKGTGLGLSTVFGIVKQAGGYVAVTSAPGEGTTFDIYLPVAQSDAAKSAALSEERDPLGGNETVLIAEDTPAIRDLTTRVLRGYGYTVLEASGGEEAMALAGKHVGNIDLLIADVIMPGMSGRALADGLQRLRPGLKVLYVSGYPEDVLGTHGILDGGVALLQKPFTPLTLAEKVRDRLAG